MQYLKEVGITIIKVIGLMFGFESVAPQHNTYTRYPVVMTFTPVMI